MQAKITLRVVNAAKAGDRDQFIWDTETRGFGLKLTKQAAGQDAKRGGGQKVYILQARLRGRVRRWRIGPHGAPWTPETARLKAKKWLGFIADGKDPKEEEGTARRDMTVAQLAAIYFAEGCEHKKPGTIATDNSMWVRHIKPLLGRRAVGDLAHADIEKFMKDVADGKTAVTVKTKARGKARVTGGKSAANRARATLSAMCSFAVKRKAIPANPCADVGKYKESGRETVLTAAQIARLGETLRKEKEAGTSPHAVTIILLLLLTGCRRNEIASLEKTAVDFERSRLVLLDTKTGRRVVPLGRAALDVLKAVPQIAGTPYMFPATTGDGHYIGVSRHWRRIRTAAGMPELRLHDLRHHFASTGVMHGEGLFLIGKVLGHRQYSTTEKYSHVHDSPLHRTADNISAEIERSLNGRQT